jgi:hypothetical protein
MSVAYIISPIEKSELRVDPDDLSANMRRKWPHISIERVVLENDPYIFRWSIELEGHRQLGGLQDSYQAISIEDYPEYAADFALWYRSIISLDYRLYLYDDDFSRHVELNEDTTKEQILNALIG